MLRQSVALSGDACACCAGVGGVGLADAHGGLGDAASAAMRHVQRCGMCSDAARVFRADALFLCEYLAEVLMPCRGHCVCTFSEPYGEPRGNARAQGKCMLYVG